MTAQSNDREISLSKGREISLEKGLREFKVEVVWQENRGSRGLRADESFDIDLIIVELDERGKALSPDHLVFYGSQEMTPDGKFTDPEKAVIHSGDDRDGTGDGEACVVYPQKVSKEATDIVFLINIYEGKQRNQTFSKIRGAEVRGFEDGSDVPKLVYKLDDDYKEDTVLVFGKMTRIDGTGKWKFVALGDGSAQTLFQSLVQYGLRFKESNI